jgi:hydroxymethylglutaryl-CoA synthase
VVQGVGQTMGDPAPRPSRGIVAAAGYLPYRRLDRATIAAVAGGGGGTGWRTVASYDEDATTMAVEASRLALREVPGLVPATVRFATVAPPYLDRTNAAAVHAALRLPPTSAAYDDLGSVRSAMGALRAAVGEDGASLVVAADLRSGLAGGPDESAFGDGASALVLDDGSRSPVLAELTSWAGLTEEFVDRWRVPGELRSRVWEERFGELRYVRLGADALAAALDRAGLSAGDVDHLVVAGTHGRAVRSVAAGSGVDPGRVVDDLSSSVGNTGAAHPFLLLASVLERAAPDEVVVLLVLADGAEAVVLRTTAALAGRSPARSLADQLAAGVPVPYGKYLAWRGVLAVEPPRRPEPARTSSSAAARSTDFKFGFVGSQDETGGIHLPPSPLDRRSHPMAEATGTVTTFTVDRLSYSPSPPTVFAVVDFDGGGRLPVELTDVDADEVAIGDRVEMTFRKLFTADGIHNYFWKARPVHEGGT